ncbi:MAG: UvrD-helicase domain-containing protein [Treponema sp.]|jgi:ATP-dependent helicase/nuclease subunit A|nr:UvrD-helicase domain-containing protein [Treponema sp.]
MNITFDEDQYAAYRADNNVAVSAGAGSGKTTVLAERYVRLVTEGGLAISEVLTLTFTRKAAAQMYSRIFTRLSESTHPLAKERLAQFDQARISTLDAFCSTITRGVSYRYGISGDFRIDDRSLVLAAEDTAVEIIMRHRHDTAIGTLVAARNFEAIVKDLFAGLALSVFSFVDSDLALPVFAEGEERTYAALGKKQADCIEKEAGVHIEKLNASRNYILSLTAENGKEPESLKKIKEALRSRAPLEPLFDKEHIEALPDVAEHYLDGIVLRGKIPDEVKEAIIDMREQFKVLKILAVSLLFREDIPALGAILDEYRQLFLDRKRQTGLLSFGDTAELAVDALKTDIDLRSYYKEYIKAIMIDEFQDNNRLQKDLLYLIAERDDRGAPGIMPSVQDLAANKLFFVGDEKQSIYRFRGADVSVFNGLSEELAKVPATEVSEAGLSIRSASLTLSTNYRSTAELVGFFNALFPGVFGEAKKLFEAKFSPMLTRKEKQDSVLPVEVYIQELRRSVVAPEDEMNSEEESAKEAGEALAAARRIIAGVKDKEFAFGDIAVLFKSTSHQNEYEKTFRQAGIPFSAADPRGLFSEGPANDFYAILRLSLFPLDRNAYATVLRSPFVKLDDESVFRIMLEKPDTPPFPADLNEKWFAAPAEKARYLHGAEVFHTLGAMLDLRGIAAAFAYLWYESGYRTYLLYNEAARDLLEHFEYLYALALDADKRQLSMSAFLDELAPFMGTTQKAETSDIPEQSDKALFLTVHKSKGLEFPVVIIANAGVEDTTVQKEKQKPYYLDPQWGVTLNLKRDTKPRDENAVFNYFFDLGETGKKLVQEQSEAELKRLFYVAATRAEKRLFIFGSRATTKDEELALDNMEAQDRLEALIRMRRVTGKSGEDPHFRQKSFLDLFTSGAAAATLPPYRLVPIRVPTIDEYKEETRRLHDEASALLARDKPPSPETEKLTPARFYNTPARNEPPSPRRAASPTRMEERNRELHSEDYRRGEDLQDFDCQRFLDRAGDPEQTPFESADTAPSHANEATRLAFGTPFESADTAPSRANEATRLAFGTPFESADTAPSRANEATRLAFGTLCHRVIEHLLSGDISDESWLEDAALEEARTLFPEAPFADKRDTGQARLAFAQEALRIARRFMVSDLGKEALAAKNRRSEFPFILPLGSEASRVLVRGSIDLIYEHNGRCTIIDFKTDKHLNIASHQVQLACYALAAEAFSGLPTRTVLVYLRESDMPARELASNIDEAQLIELARSLT